MTPFRCPDCGRLGAFQFDGRRSESAGLADKVAEAVDAMARFYEWDAVPFEDHGLPEKHVIAALTEWRDARESSQ